MQNYQPNPKLARAVEVLFILHAEHEMNCSTAAVRCLSRCSRPVVVFMSLTFP